MARKKIKKASKKRSSNAPSRRSIMKRTSQEKTEYVKSIEKEIQKLQKEFARLGEDSVEDRVDLLEDQVKSLVRRGKITREQAKIFNNKLDALDD